MIYVNDLQFTSDVLGPIIFTDNTNLLYVHVDINGLFLKISNKKLINDLFLLSSFFFLENRILFFLKSIKNYDLPLLLPRLRKNNLKIKQTESIKFLSVLLDEKLTWKARTKYIENKIEENIGSLFKATVFFNKQTLLSLCYSSI